MERFFHLKLTKRYTMNNPTAGLPQYNGTFPYANVDVGLVHTQSHIMATGMSEALQCSLPNHLLAQNPNYPIHLFSMLDIKAKENLDRVSKTYAVKFPTNPTLKIISDVPAVNSRQISTIRVDKTSHLQPNDMYHDGLWGEAMMIVAVTGEHQVDVLRGVGTTAPTGIPKGSNLTFGGNTHEEASMRPLPRHSESTTMQAFSGISRDAWAMTDTARAIMMSNPKMFGTDVQNEFEEAKRYHAFGIEAKMLLSQYSATRHNGMPMRTFSGLADQVKLAAPQNIVSVIGGMNYESLVAMFDSFITNEITGHTGSNQRVIYGDSALVRAISKIGRNFSDFNMFDGSDMFGRSFKGFNTDLGQFTVYNHNLLEHRGQNNGMGFIIDPTVLELSYMPTRKAQVKWFNFDTNGKVSELSMDNGLDAGGGVITSEFTMFNYNPASHGMIFGLNQVTCEDVCKRPVSLSMMDGAPLHVHIVQADGSPIEPNDPAPAVDPAPEAPADDAADDNNVTVDMGGQS